VHWLCTPDEGMVINFLGEQLSDEEIYNVGGEKKQEIFDMHKTAVAETNK
jgi:hypothetical protein